MSGRGLVPSPREALEQLLEVEPPSPPGAPQERLDLVSGETERAKKAAGDPAASVSFA